MSETLLFDKLELSGWRQFRDVKIDFHDRLTVLTGANGAGKSTILKLLKCHFPYESDENFLATPIQKEGKTKFSFGAWWSTRLDSIFSRDVPEDSEEIGKISFSNNENTLLKLPSSGSLQYALKRTAVINVNGVSISSHRSLPRYNEIKNIPMLGIKPEDAYKDFFDIQKSNTEQALYVRDGAHRPVNPVAAIKQALISFATFGIGNNYIAPIPDLVGLYDEFQDVLRVVLPSEVGFQRLEIRPPEVIVISSSGEFPIDAASGGLMSIIQLSWQIFLQKQIYGLSRFMVLIDEPENHLHPSMQRSFLSNVVDAFPTARFVVATHSPFVISSVRDSTVYALRHHNVDGTSPLRPLEPRSVNAERLGQLQKGGPANDILREVLGVPVTMPEWSESELQRIAEEFARDDLTKDSLAKLRLALQRAGLSEFYTQTLERMVR